MNHGYFQNVNGCPDCISTLRTLNEGVARVMEKNRNSDPDPVVNEIKYGESLPPAYLDKANQMLAEAIANQAQAIADGTVTGPMYGAVQRLKSNIETLVAWTEDDRT
jgi:hypothetical protein